MPGKFKRPTLERDVTGLVGPEQAPPVDTGQGGVPGLGVQGVPQPPPPELQTQTLQVQGPNRGLSAIADFLTGFGGGPQAAIAQQQQRAGQTERLFQAQERPINLRSQLAQQQFQNRLRQEGLGLSERDVSLREQQFARPKISTFQSRDGRRLLTVNTKTGELINSLNTSEPISTQRLADFISNFENSLGSPLNPNEQAILSVAGQSALQNGNLGTVASALDGIATGREGFRRKRGLAKEATGRKLGAEQREAEREQAKNNRLAVQAERQAILRENSAIRKQISTLRRDLFRGDIRGGRKTKAQQEITRLRGALSFNEVQVEELEKELRQLSGKKSLLRQGIQPEQRKNRLQRKDTSKPNTAEDFLRKRRGNRQ